MRVLRKHSLTIIEILMVVTIISMFGALFSSKASHVGTEYNFKRDCANLKNHLALLRRKSIYKGSLLTAWLRNTKGGLRITTDNSSKDYSHLRIVKSGRITFSPSGNCTRSCLTLQSKNGALQQSIDCQEFMAE